MADLPRYRPSGRFGITTLPLLVVAAVAGGLLALPYQYLLKWLPVVQVSVLLVLLFALAVAVAAYFATRRGHCRNRVVAAVGGLCVGAAALAGSYYWEALRVRAEVGEDIPLMDALRIKRDAGWRIGNGSGAPLSGGGTYLVWGVEGLTVLLLALGGGLAGSSTPYCEKCKRFCEDQKFSVGGLGRAQAEPLLASGKLGALALIDPGQEQGKALHFELTLCPGCGQTAFLSVDEKQVTMKSNKRQEKSSSLVKHAILSPADREQAVMRARELIGQKLAS